MANYKSVSVTNVTAAPQVPVHKLVGAAKALCDTVEVTTAMIDNADDNIFILPIQSDARLLKLEIFSDDLDADVSPALAYNIGLAYSGFGSGQVKLGKVFGDLVDNDCIGTAVTVGQSANVVGGQLQFEAADIANIGKPLWEVGGLASDPGGIFYLVLDVSTAAATPAAGTLSVYALYI